MRLVYRVDPADSVLMFCISVREGRPTRVLDLRWFRRFFRMGAFNVEPYVRVLE